MVKIWIGQDPEKQVVSFLKDSTPFKDVPVGTIRPTEVGNTRAPLPFIQIQSTGGNTRDAVASNYQITVTCWAKTFGQANHDARIVQGLLKNADDLSDLSGVPCYGVRAFAEPYSDPDPITHTPRVSATYSITLRGDYATI